MMEAETSSKDGIEIGRKDREYCQIKTEIMSSFDLQKSDKHLDKTKR